MITLQQLEIFARYKGDVDLFARSGTVKESQLIDDADWHLIDTLIQDAYVIRQGLGSEHRTAQAMARLEEKCANAEVVEEIKRFSKVN